jgi:hypothetical protein
LSRPSSKARGTTRAHALLANLISDFPFAFLPFPSHRCSVFITGSAGTGKSLLLKAIQTALPKVEVTASTGLAAVNIGGTTLHSWAGIGLGEDKVDTLVARIRRNRMTLSVPNNGRPLLTVSDVASLSARFSFVCSGGRPPLL